MAGSSTMSGACLLGLLLLTLLLQPSHAQDSATDNNTSQNSTADTMLNSTDSDNNTVDTMLNTRDGDNNTVDSMLNSTDGDADNATEHTTSQNSRADTMLNSTDGDNNTVDTMLNSTDGDNSTADTMLNSTDGDNSTADTMPNSTDGDNTTVDTMLNTTDTDNATEHIPTPDAMPTVEPTLMPTSQPTLSPLVLPEIEQKVSSEEEVDAAIKALFGMNFSSSFDELSLNSSALHGVVGAINTTQVIATSTRTVGFFILNSSMQSAHLALGNSTTPAVVVTDFGTAAKAVVTVTSPSIAAADLGLNLNPNLTFFSTAVTFNRFDEDGNADNNQTISFVFVGPEDVSEMGVLYFKEGDTTDHSVQAMGGSVTPLGGGMFSVSMSSTSTFIGYEATCSNGLMDGSEEAVDCGGSCAPCLLPGEYNITFNIDLNSTAFNVSNGEDTVEFTLQAKIPGMKLDKVGHVAFIPDDKRIYPFYAYLKFCDWTVPVNYETDYHTWTCHVDLPEVLSGTKFQLSWVDLYIYPEGNRVLVPTRDIPPVNLTIYSTILIWEEPVEMVNVTGLDTYTAFWSILLGGERGQVYTLNSDANTTQSWVQYPTPVKDESKSGLTGACYYSKYEAIIIGGRDYDTGEYGRGFIMMGNASSRTNVSALDVVLDDYPSALTDVGCKPGPSPNGIQYLVVGLDNTILVSSDALTWRNASYIPKVSALPVNFTSLSCSSELVCMAMGSAENGLIWQTFIFMSEDGGDTWGLQSSIPSDIMDPSQRKERGSSMSCALATPTCYLTTELYTGTNVRRTDDYGVTWTLLDTWDVLADVQLDCFWPDECIAGAGTWLGRWNFPSEVRLTDDAGLTWKTIYKGEIGEHIGQCKCGGRNNALCLCTSNMRLIVYDIETGELSNMTFPYTMGPIAEFQSYFAGDILAELYMALNGDEWLNKLNWMSGNPCSGDWYGVKCTAADGAAKDVQSIKLNANGLSGTIPAIVGYLVGLETFELNTNQIHGRIPSSVGRMESLKKLALFNNQISGTLTNKLAYLPNLEHIALFNNEFVGSIPEQYGNMPSLQYMYLYNNDFDSTIPSSFGELQNLKWLSLRNNQLTGTLPKELGNLENLKALDISRNFLVGSIPTEWEKLNQLAHFDVSDNRLNSIEFKPVYPGPIRDEL